MDAWAEFIVRVGGQELCLHGSPGVVGLDRLYCWLSGNLGWGPKLERRKMVRQCSCWIVLATTQLGPGPFLSGWPSYSLANGVLHHTPPPLSHVMCSTTCKMACPTLYGGRLQDYLLIMCIARIYWCFPNHTIHPSKLINRPYPYVCPW